MKNKKRILMACMVGMLALSPAVGYVGKSSVVYASAIDNDFSSGKKTTSSGNTTKSSNTGKSNSLGSVLDEGTVSDDDRALGNFLGEHRGVSSEQLNSASEMLSPVTNAIGYVAAFIIALTASAIFLITALDILYIAIPPIRSFLYTAGTDGTGAYTAGRYGGGPGGYGPGGYPQGGSGSRGGSRTHQFISDEAVACAALLGGSSRTENMGAPGQPRSNETKGSVIKAYLIKRAGFMVLFVVCVVILMSSALMGTGANLANFGIKVITAVNKTVKGYTG